MEDRVLKVKKEINGIVKAKGITRMDKYKLVKKMRKELSKKELRILIMEYHREYESIKALEEATGLTTAALTGLSLFVAVTSLYCNKAPLGYEQFGALMFIIGASVIVILWVFTVTHIFRERRLERVAYILGMLED